MCKMCTKVILNGKIPRLALAIDPCPLESARFLTTSAVLKGVPVIVLLQGCCSYIGENLFFTIYIYIYIYTNYGNLI